MKKLIAMLMVLAMSLTCFVGCGSSTAATENADTQEATTEAAKESKKENTEEYEPVLTDLGGMVLVDNEEFKITANSMGKYKISKDGILNNTRINVTVENKSQEDCIYVREVYVNNLRLDVSWQIEEKRRSDKLEIAPGETKDATISITDYDLVKVGEELTDITLGFKCGGIGSDKTMYFSEHIYPLGEENVVAYEHKLVETDTLVADSENVRIIITNSIQDIEDQYFQIELLVENKTDKNVYFTTSDAHFNDNKYVIYHDEEVIPAGLTIKDYVYIDSEELEYYKETTGIEVSFDEITEITFTAWVMDADTFTENTYWEIEDWRYEQGGLETFNPDDYALAKGTVTAEVQGAEEGKLLVSVGERENVEVNEDANESSNTPSSVAAEMSADMIQIDGVTYVFPMAVQELANNGWVMKGNFPFPARPGSNALVGFTKGALELETNVTSVTGMEVPMEEGSISYMSFTADHNNDIPVVFPGNITLGMSKDNVENALPSGFVYDDGKDCHKFERQETNGKLVILIMYSGNEVEEISYSFWS